ncbi:PREDICTED: uncharacterized protein LOC108563641 [Nicrophorus vespilloides]|uniref:Uncharacterized protein LOC108563641 n=1 Tax=Nicrophorus vespilloides TaxID=110193 RepID=A0ABM1MTG7_NICVS|nr:PREDICTED: uncharacterized protein LOC108563641 [Nicrophorus vespilloides]
MDNESVENVSRLSSRESSHKDLTASRSSIKSTKSVDKNSSSASQKGEKDVHFQKGSVKIKADEKKMELEYRTGTDPSIKVPNKIIANWRHACDRTRDRTRDLLKRWRTLPEYEVVADKKIGPKLDKTDSQNESCGWSVHVWTTWVDRFSVDTMEAWENESQLFELTPIQTNKFTHFFTTLLDHDQDELICDQDFGALIERLRHFADWSTNSPEYNILREVERGFMDTFLQEIHDEKLGFQVNGQTYLTLDGWLYKWAQLVTGSKSLNDFPIWLQYFVKVLFQVINRTNSGIITKEELNAFYSSVLGLESSKVDEILNLAYYAMTSNGDHLLGFKAFRLCFSNYLLGRYPNGPGHYILGATPLPLSSALFPVDYSALNAQPEDLEQYVPDNKTNRRSVIV